MANIHETGGHKVDQFNAAHSQAIDAKDVHSVVVSYLIHNCFKETLESFAACAGLPDKLPVSDHDDIGMRKRILRLVAEGDALAAIGLAEGLAGPGFLDRNADLHFELLSLYFAVLVRTGRCTEALEFAQESLTPFGRIQKYVERLEDFMALLAYEEPEKSPMFHLLTREYSQSVADSLNRAILENANMPSYSSMERLVRQAIVVWELLTKESAGKELALPSSLKEFLKC